VTVMAEGGRIDSQRAVSLGLIVTELVLNAIKYAFPKKRTGARIQVSYETAGSDWKLTVSDNGVGKIANDVPATGLGTAIVEALVKQLEARVEIISDIDGTSVSVTRATFTSRVPRAA
ncbi:sensor histidine kinase, partial [Mesorhizobium sp. M7A.F.Ca.ET.027.03.2.1]